MVNVIDRIKSLFSFDWNAYRKNFAFGEIDDLTREIKQTYEYAHLLEQRRHKAEVLAFLELRG